MAYVHWVGWEWLGLGWVGHAEWNTGVCLRIFSFRRIASMLHGIQYQHQYHKYHITLWHPRCHGVYGAAHITYHIPGRHGVDTWYPIPYRMSQHIVHHTSQHESRHIPGITQHTRCHMSIWYEYMNIISYHLSHHNYHNMSYDHRNMSDHTPITYRICRN